MQVRIPNDLGNAHLKVFKKHFDRDHNLFSSTYRNYEELDLKDLSIPDLKLVETAVRKTPEIRGAKALARDIKTWIDACSSLEGCLKAVRARSVRQAAELLTQLLRHVPRHQVYIREQEGDEGVSLCYYVNEIEFHERYKDTPARIQIELMYYEFDKKSSWSLWLEPSQCVGMTSQEILTNLDIMLPTQDLRDNYDQWLVDFEKWRGLVGTQFLARGIADDQNIDGNEKDDDDRRWWYSSRTSKFRLDKDGEPSRVVVDVFKENNKEDDNDYRHTGTVNRYFWEQQIRDNKTVPGTHDYLDWIPEDEDGWDEKDKEGEGHELGSNIEIPIHPYVAVFDLKRHKRLRIHVGNLEPYTYDTSIRSKLVLPEKNSKLIDTLLIEKESKFKDVVRGKSGGTIILCQGPPGTGKTLTAEIYSESLQRPLYTVQCSQLGTDPESLEDALMKVLARGRRWGAVMLLDEADVYVHTRGVDLQQNAIVGVFLRVLEYHSGVLFLTTNRGDLVDDAILSRCTARVPYEVPTPDGQQAIWEVLSDTNGIELGPKAIEKIVDRHPKLSGRDIKNLLKLAAMVAHDRKCRIDADLISEVKVFKPTADGDVIS